MKKRIFAGFFAALLALSACGRPEEEYQRQVREVARLTQELRTVTEERDRLRTEVTRLQGENQGLRDRLAALGQSVEQTQADLESARRRALDLCRAQQAGEARMVTYRQMMQRFRTMMDSGRLRVRPSRGRLVIELPAGILFASGRAELQAAGQEVLTQVASVLRDIADRDFLVAGHTDDQPLGRGSAFRDNWDLSTQRAANVLRFLQQQGLQPRHLGASGYAEFQPVAANDSDPNRQLNRRVEIILMPNINELPDLSALEGGGGATAAPVDCDAIMRSTTPPAAGGATPPAAGGAAAPAPAAGAAAPAAAAH